VKNSINFANDAIKEEITLIKQSPHVAILKPGKYMTAELHTDMGAHDYH